MKKQKKYYTHRTCRQSAKYLNPGFTPVHYPHDCLLHI
jgi:hypothetical protein